MSAIDCVLFIVILFLPAATKLRQGNAFTSVCDSVRGVVSVQGGFCQGDPPPVQLRAGSTHPTGMHSCYCLFIVIRLMGKKWVCHQFCLLFTPSTFNGTNNGHGLQTLRVNKP